MNRYAVTYVTVTGRENTVYRTGQTPESARQSFAQWQLNVGDTALAQRASSPVLVDWESSVM